jgi:4-amino-4-deoxy-L-arabinose transferase-like glycosyltransferase
VSESAVLRPSFRFLVQLGTVAVFAFFLRVTYVYLVARHTHLGQDALWYTLVSGPLSDGKGYLSPGVFFSSGRSVATAGYPPLYPGFLALVTRVANGDHETFRFAGCVMGTVTVLLTGLIALRVSGRRVALLAAMLVAIYPALLAVDGAVMSETISIPLLYAGVLLAVIAIERPRWWWFAALGGVFGAMALARADAFIPMTFVVGAAVIAMDASIALRIAGVALTLVAAAVVVAPWIVRNNERVGEPTIATISSSATIAGANCDTTYSGPLIGMWDLACMDAGRQGTLGELRWSREARHLGTAYARAHASRVPIVVIARELRTLGLLHPFSETRREATEGRSYRWQLLAWGCWLPLLAGGSIGLVRLVRADRRAWPLLGVVLAVGATAAVSYGNQRFRTAAEPAMLIATAAAITKPRSNRVEIRP